MENIIISLPNNKKIGAQYGNSLRELISDADFDNNQLPVMAVRVNNRMVSLNYKVKTNCIVEPVFIDTSAGMKIYKDSLAFLLCMAAAQSFPDHQIVISHSLGDGYFFYFEGLNEVSDEMVGVLNKTMAQKVAEDLPINRNTISYQDAVNYFETARHSRTSELLLHRNDHQIPIYQCESYIDIAHGPIVHATGILKTYKLEKYKFGLMIRAPRRSDLNTIQPFEDHPVLFKVYQEHKDWGKILGVDSIGSLNLLSEKRRIGDFIQLAEALHDKKIASIADAIAEKGDKIKTVLIAGPSSSGKTTFTKKLAVQLRVLGYDPSLLSLDDYFVDRDKTPRDEKGDYDFEALEAIDVPTLNTHMLELFDGKEVEIPAFDFHLGRRKEKGHSLKLGEKGLLIMEGIHGLNDGLTPQIPRENKFLIYISALTQLNLDEHNRIPTTDNRLIRRMVRDYQFRGYSALDTIKRWPSVRKGEDRNIFPFQNSADMAFNSALDYELGVLKVYAEPLLRQVKPWEKEYSEAVRLLSFLDNFIPIPSFDVPNYSILREFIGNSGFKY